MKNLLNDDNIMFYDKCHKDFYYVKINLVKNMDVYNQSLIYLLGISENTREHFDTIFDIKTGLIKPGCLDKVWNTSTTLRTIRLAFNLYTDKIPQEDIENCNCYSVSNIFCNSYAPYYWQGVKLRYSEYCR